MGKMSDKQKQRRRENRRKKRIAAAKERHLKNQNEFGINDPTPREAVNNIINYHRDKKVKQDEGEETMRTMSV